MQRLHTQAAALRLAVSRRQRHCRCVQPLQQRIACHRRHARALPVLRIVLPKVLYRACSSANPIRSVEPQTLDRPHVSPTICSHQQALPPAAPLHADSSGDWHAEGRPKIRACQLAVRGAGGHQGTVTPVADPLPHQALGAVCPPPHLRGGRDHLDFLDRRRLSAGDWRHCAMRLAGSQCCCLRPWQYANGIDSVRGGALWSNTVLHVTSGARAGHPCSGLPASPSISGTLAQRALVC